MAAVASRDDSRFRCLVESTSDGYIVYDGQGRLLDVNQSACEISGHGRERLLGMSIDELLSPADGEQLTEIDELFCDGRPAAVRARLRCADGDELPAELRVGAVGEEGAVEFVALLRDVSEQTYLAEHDGLTGLLNCSSFTRHLKNAIERSSRGGGSLSLLHVDLDRFSLINQALGHAAGDELLGQVASRLRETTGAMDLVARYSADQFLVLHTDDAEPERLAERVHAAFESPFSVEGTELYVNASVGISVFPLDADDASVLLRHADSAAQQAKRPGRPHTVRFADETSDKWARLSLATRLRKAIERDELVLHYQPIVDLQAGGDPVCAVEALVRWRDRDGDLIPPGTFVPLAEDVGLIDALGDWVVGESARQASDWRDEGVDITVSLNVSLRQLWTPGLVERMVASVASESGKPADFIVELTETAAMTDPVKTEAVLHELRGEGFQLAIDDFGAGHSSLTRLWQMPAQLLKIDRSFVARLPDDGNVAAMVTAMVQLARSLGMTAVAEGIETEEQRRFLIEAGCPWGQGFLLSRPLPPAELHLRQDQG